MPLRDAATERATPDATPDPSTAGTQQALTRNASPFRPSTAPDHPTLPAQPYLTPYLPQPHLRFPFNRPSSSPTAMLAFMSPSPNAALPPQDPPHAYAPTRSSPLTPRDPNAHLARRPFSFAYTNSAMDAQAPQGAFGKAAQPTPFARRDVKPNPLIQRSGSDVARERRRDMFLRRVANDRDDRRWSARSEQILRLDYVQRQKRWEADMARRAPKAAEPSSDGDDYQDAMWDVQDDVVVASSQATNWSDQRPLSQWQRSESLEEEADVVAQQEDAELEALLDMMEEEEQCQDDDSPAFGSDDEYDHIFDEAVNAPPRNMHGLQQCTTHDTDDMDMTG